MACPRSLSFHYIPFHLAYHVIFFHLFLPSLGHNAFPPMAALPMSSSHPSRSIYTSSSLACIYSTTPSTHDSVHTADTKKAILYVHSHSIPFSPKPPLPTATRHDPTYDLVSYSRPTSPFTISFLYGRRSFLAFCVLPMRLALLILISFSLFVALLYAYRSVLCLFA
ncbi:uncharacterized protein EDB91DRAFT_22958 [Suillus paluster]|uniref:uncharacterized protein n=1 Tax=Suillus paluster TaxID=48578 RepID=UPI001B879017|nr:uncharacterized protein EDB91DRAFT_22958 [Suillus paluster]KAG1756546.1 hypothetical protein EDB91DRAFT_22958 [Suillus paluster]